MEPTAADCSEAPAASGGARHGERFGNPVLFTEPAWYQGFFSPYYDQSHRDFRALVRAFVETKIKPNIDEWLAAGTCA